MARLTQVGAFPPMDTRCSIVRAFSRSKIPLGRPRWPRRSRAWRLASKGWAYTRGHGENKNRAPQFYGNPVGGRMALHHRVFTPDFLEGCPRDSVVAVLSWSDVQFVAALIQIGCSVENEGPDADIESSGFRASQKQIIVNHSLTATTRPVSQINFGAWAEGKRYPAMGILLLILGAFAIHAG